MERFYSKVIKHRKLIMGIYLVIAIICFFCRNGIAVNYNMSDYLPEDAASSVALDVMDQEFSEDIANARVMVKADTQSEALAYKEELEQVDGVKDVTWIDDTLGTGIPALMAPSSMQDTYLKDGYSLFSVTIDEEKRQVAVSGIREVIGEDGAMTGNAVSTAVATESTVMEIKKIAVIAVLFVLLVLTITTTSWVEPFVVMAGLGVAIVINAGSNLIFGEISFVTNAAGNILQLAVSLDYSVFLIHRFAECKERIPDPEEAMLEALCKSTSSIASSGLTTVIGFMALVLMQFRIGPDLGLALGKGIAISLLTVFLFMPGLILATYNLMERTSHRSFLPDFDGFGRLIQRLMVPMTIVMALVVIPSYYFSTQNSYYFGSSHIFSAGTSYGDDTAKIEKIFGKSDTYVLMVPTGDTDKEQELVTTLEETKHVTSVTALSTLTGNNSSVPAEMMPSELTEKLDSGKYSRMAIAVDVEYEGDTTFNLVETIRSEAEKEYPGEWYLAGEGVSTYDLMDTITSDMNKVNLIAIGAVFLVLLLMFRNPVLPVLLVLTIEEAIWLNFTIPHFTGTPIFYIAYLIISSIQLGATVDYAILLTDRYREKREQGLAPGDAVHVTVGEVTGSILTSGTVLTVVGFLLSFITSHGILRELGHYLGVGTILSVIMVFFVLPGLLTRFDRFARKPGTPSAKELAREPEEAMTKDLNPEASTDAEDDESSDSELAASL